MPISAAVSGSCATARIPRPNRVRLTNMSSATSMSSADDHDEQRVRSTAARRRSRRAPSASRSPAACRTAPRLVKMPTPSSSTSDSTDRGDQEDQRWRVLPPQRPVRDPLDGHRGTAGGHRAADQTATSRKNSTLPTPRTVRPRRSAPHTHRRRTPHHEHLGMREVDQPQHTVHEGVAQRDEGVDRAVAKPSSCAGPGARRIRRSPKRLPDGTPDAAGGAHLRPHHAHSLGLSRA